MKRGMASVLVLFSAFVIAQGDPDLLLTLGHQPLDSTLPKKRQVNYVFNGKRWYVKYNPLNMVFGGTLFFYQKVISPQIVMGCSFEPSCSAFAKGCIHEYGVIKGVALAADRLTRCTRIGSVDSHPVHLNSQGVFYDPPAYYRLRNKQ